MSDLAVGLARQWLAKVVWTRLTSIATAWGQKNAKTGQNYVEQGKGNIFALVFWATKCQSKREKCLQVGIYLQFDGGCVKIPQLLRAQSRGNKRKCGRIYRMKDISLVDWLIFGYANTKFHHPCNTWVGQEAGGGLGEAGSCHFSVQMSSLTTTLMGGNPIPTGHFDT